MKLKLLPLVLVMLSIGCGCQHQQSTNSRRPISLPQYHGHTRDAVVGALGEPDYTERFTMAEAYGEMRVGLMNTYPPNDPANASVLIKELRWKDGDHWVTLWLHEVGDEWIVLDSLRWQKDVRF